MAPDEQHLTHEEIWDDSALVTSWNDALEEYKVLKHASLSRSMTRLTGSKKYHSIHSKGGNVEELNTTNRLAQSLPQAH